LPDIKAANEFSFSLEIPNDINIIDDAKLMNADIQVYKKIPQVETSFTD
jgi:hypothetical protein